MNTHTATPWGIELDYRDRTKTIITSKLDDYMVASCNHAICNDPQNEANAAFICRACNSHEALCDALRNVLTRLDLEPVEAVFPCSAMRESIRQALKLAEGGE